MNIYIESLGCARNQVDSETMLARLAAAGCRIADDPDQAEVIIVNTCSFIESAANESIDTILALAEYKRSGRCQRLVVAGCLPERYRAEIVQALPEADLFLGTGAYDRIAAAVQGLLKVGTCLLPDPDSVDIRHPLTRTPFSPHAAYVKISEGCDRHCTYCIIPQLRGRQKSRSLDDIVQECRALIADGVKELTLVGQETTAYGADGGAGSGLAPLLEALAGLDSSVWVRFLYGHPESLASEVISTVARFPNLCPYFDIPIQHASTAVLRRMGRHYTADEVLRLFDTIRAQVPDVVLRTTVLVGFPGEQEADFQQLRQLIEQVRFDHLGVFAYSDAQDLSSHHLDGQVDARIARKRLNTLMRLQRDISSANLTRYLHRDLEVLVESGPEGGEWVGRTRFQAPEVDGNVYLRLAEGRPAPAIGSLVSARIVDTMEYDLVAQVMNCSAAG